MKHPKPANVSLSTMSLVGQLSVLKSELAASLAEKQALVTEVRRACAS